MLRWKVALMALLLVGCAPSQARKALIQADQTILSAQAQDADKHSPYEFHSAERYRDQARRVQGQGEYEQARRFAHKAAAFAIEAYDQAEINKALREAMEKKIQELGAETQGETP